MDQVVQNLGIEAAVISVPAEQAQWAADKLVAGGVKAILNLTPVVLVVPREVAVRNVDIASELMMLSYYCGEVRKPAEAAAAGNPMQAQEA